MNKNQAQHDFTGSSFIISTPKPTASSTVEKKHVPLCFNKNYAPGKINYSLISEVDGNSVESLGILSLEEVDLTSTSQLEHQPHKKDAVEDESFSRLKTQRLLAQKTLNKVKSGLPSRFLVPSESYDSVTALENIPKCESTVNEADLLTNATPARELRNSCFNPNDVSTPRSSGVGVGITEMQRSGSVSLFEGMTNISKKIRSSDISLKELCSQLGKFSLGSEQNISELSSRMFKPAELAGQKLMEDELSWRKEYGFPCGSDVDVESSKESSFLAGAFDVEKCSVGNFFKQKSDEVLDAIFSKTSPERKEPVPLIDVTNTLQETQGENEDTRNTTTNVLSVSRIAKIISSADSQDSPNKVINYLLKPKKAEVFSKDESVSVGQKNLEVSDDEDLLSCKSSSSGECALDSSVEKLDSGVDMYSKRLGGKNSSDENKENFSRLTDRSISSTGTASSLSTLPEGKFPIKSTRTELAWGCVKLLHSNTQEFFIRNQLNQRIRMQASITGLCFRILKDRGADSDVLTAITFLLHPMETKSFYVSFCPTTPGGYCEKLQFHPIINGKIQGNKKQTLALYGYGGHVSLDIANIAKDSNGKRWLSLGTVHHKSAVVKKFTIKNNGTLNAFVCIDVHSKGLYAFSVVYVQPNELILKPQEESIVTITFTPAKKDFLDSAASEVIEIGLLKVIYGAEPLRGRLRRLYSKLKQKGEIPDPILERLSAYFPDEAMPGDLKLFKETVGVTKELLQQLMVKEIIITVEQDLENTLIGHMDIDETSIYQTLGPNNTNFSVLENETMREAKWHVKVEPSSILLTPPTKTEDVIFIHSENAKPLHFEAIVEPAGVFQIYPSMGTIASKGDVFLKIGCSTSKIIGGRGEGKVSVFVENDVVEISVKCIFIK